MDQSTQRFSLSEVSFFFLWWTSVIISAFVYVGEIATFNFSNACRATDIVSFLVHISNPKYWFGIFTVGLTIWASLFFFKRLSSLYPRLADIRWLIVLFIVAFLLILPLTGCR